MSGKLARAYFEQRGSATPVPVSHSDLEALAHDAQLALYHVASGLLSQARHDVARALLRADKALESLNRESLSAQQLLDACLFLARAHLMAHEHQQALEQALECRRRVPEVQPDPKMHPPEVIGLVAEAEAELRLRNPGSLRVESEPGACTVYVNGRPLGRAPLELPQLSPGEYRLQAECTEGEIGRVHRVTVGTERVVKRIDTRFDAAVVTSLELSLRYGNVAEMQAHGAADAAEVGRVVGAQTVLWVHPALDATAQPGIVDVSRVRVRDAAPQAQVRLRAHDEKSASLAIAALEQGRSIDLSGAPPRDLDSAAQGQPATPTARKAGSQPAVESAPPLPEASRQTEPTQTTPASNESHDGPGIAPIIVTSSGGAILIVGVITGVLAHSKLGDLEKQCPTTQCTYPGLEHDRQVGQTLQTTSDVLLIVGGAAAVTGAVWWLLSARGNADQPNVSTSAACVPGSCGVSLTGRF
jgi:hypothetical protein